MLLKKNLSVACELTFQRFSKNRLKLIWGGNLDLNKEITLAILQLCGNIPIRKALLIKKKLQAQDYWKPHAKNKTIYYHDPLIYVKFRELITFSTSLTFGGSI